MDVKMNTTNNYENLWVCSTHWCINRYLRWKVWYLEMLNTYRKFPRYISLIYHPHTQRLRFLHVKPACAVMNEDSRWEIANWQFDSDLMDLVVDPLNWTVRERFLMGTYVNTRLFKYPRQNSCTGTELGTHISGTQRLNTAPFCAGSWVLVLGHQVWTQPQ